MVTGGVLGGGGGGDASGETAVVGPNVPRKRRFQTCSIYIAAMFNVGGTLNVGGTMNVGGVGGMVRIQHLPALFIQTIQR